MADYEKYGFRDAAYSAWHRPESIKRYIDEATAKSMRQIDMDAILGDDIGLHDEGTTWVEFPADKSWPIALIETAVDVGQPDKIAYATQNLARISNLPGGVVLYKLSERPNPVKPDVKDIDSFRARKLWPNPQAGFRNFSPSEYVKWLLAAREIGAKRWQQFIEEERLRIEAKELWEALEEERERSRELACALEREKERSRELMLSILAERKSARKKREAQSELQLPSLFDGEQF